MSTTYVSLVLTWSRGGGGRGGRRNRVRGGRRNRVRGEGGGEEEIG